MRARAGGFSDIRLKVDHNGTRVAARRRLLFSTIRMVKPLKVGALASSTFKADKGGKKWNPLDAKDWTIAAKIEALLAIPGNTSTFQQSEKLMVAALGVTLKQNMMDKLRAETLSVVDLDAVGPTLPLARKEVPVSSLDEVSKECRRRGTEEAERRYCGNTTYAVTGQPISLTTREKLAFALDPRTCRFTANFMKPFSNEIKALLKDNYAESGMTAYDYLAAKAKKKEEKVAAAAAAAALDYAPMRRLAHPTPPVVPRSSTSTTTSTWTTARAAAATGPLPSTTRTRRPRARRRTPGPKASASARRRLQRRERSVTRIDRSSEMASRRLTVSIA